MTKEEMKAELAALKEKYVTKANLAKYWREMVIVLLILCAIFAFWRWQVHASEAARLKSLVEIGATIEDSRARLEALDKRAAEREKQIEAAIEASRRLDKELQDKRDALKKASAARVSQIPRDAAGVAAELTKLGFPAKPVEAK